MSRRITAIALLATMLSSAAHGASDPVPEPAAIDPAVPYEVLLLKGNLARNHGDIAAVNRYFSAAASKDSAGERLYLLWSRALMALGDRSGAINTLSSGLQSFPESVYIKLEICGADPRNETVDSLLSEIPESQRDHPFYLLAAGYQALDSRDYEKASEQLSRSAATPHVYRADSYAALAEAERRLGNLQRQKVALENAIRLATTNDQRDAFASHLEDASSQPPAGDARWFVLTSSNGLQYDSNINLAPLLFTADTAGVRVSSALLARTYFFKNDDTNTGIALFGSQSIHAGADQEALEAYNATVFDAAAFFEAAVTGTHKLGAKAGYSSTFLFFKPDDQENHFRERIYGQPSWSFRSGDFSLFSDILLELSRYYADNRYLSPDDRSTDTIDLNLRVAPAYRIGQHRISALLGMSRYDARGSNFDKIGGSFAASYAFQHKQWLTTLRSGYALLEYPDSTDGRQDRRLTASIGTEFAVNAKHRVGGALAYEENFPSYTDSVYAYRRILAGVNYRGTFFEK